MTHGLSTDSTQCGRLLPRNAVALHTLRVVGRKQIKGVHTTGLKSAERREGQQWAGRLRNDCSIAGHSVHTLIHRATSNRPTQTSYIIHHFLQLNELVANGCFYVLYAGRASCSVASREFSTICTASHATLMCVLLFGPRSAPMTCESITVVHTCDQLRRWLP